MDNNNFNNNNDIDTVINNNSINKNKKSGVFLGFIFGVLITFFVICALVALDKTSIIKLPFINNDNYIINSQYSENNDEIYGFDLELIKKLADYKEVLEEYYYKDIDNNKLYEGMIKGMYKSVDDIYTQYYTAEEWKEFLEQTTGNYVGIGAYIEYVDNGIKITKPIQGSPALEAGLKSGDLIVEVDGENVMSLGHEIALSKIKGEENTEVNLKIIRDNDSFNITVKRRSISVPSVSSALINKTGIIQINQFDSNVSKEFVKHYNNLVENSDAENLIIDLRNNPGGELNECVSLTGMLVDESKILDVVYKDDYKEAETSNNDKIKLPYVILINENSASASEVLSAAVKDYEEGLIIGTTSFGKGLVQYTIPLGLGDGAKITSATYYSPLGKNVQGEGVEPDIVIDMDINNKKDIDGMLQKLELSDVKEDIQLIKALDIINK